MDLTRFEEGTRGTARPSISLPGARRAASQAPELAPGPLPVSAVIDDADAPIDVLDLLILDAFTSGRQPFARTAGLDNVLPHAPLMPADGRVIRDAAHHHTRSILACGPGWTCLCVHWNRSSSAKITITAVTQELADEKLSEATRMP